MPQWRSEQAGTLNSVGGSCCRALIDLARARPILPRMGKPSKLSEDQRELCSTVMWRGSVHGAGGDVGAWDHGRDHRWRAGRTNSHVAPKASIMRATSVRGLIRKGSFGAGRKRRARDGG